jgi:soluble cytochrome b562
MKKQLFLLGCAAGLMLIPARAQDKEHTALGKQMEAMNDAFKAFRKETDPVKGATQAREAQAALVKGINEVPETIKEMPEGPEKAKAFAAYHKMIGKLYVALCEVEEAFLNGKIDEVAKLVDSLKEMKKTGHKEFVKEDE